MQLLSPDEALRIATSRDAQRDPAALLDAWECVLAAQPRHIHALRGVGDALRRLGRFDEADQVLEGAMAAFPDNVGIANSHGWVANDRQDWPEAERRWAAFRSRFAGHPAGYLWGARAATALQQHREAERLLTEGVTRFPEDSVLCVDHAQSAVRLRDWQAALTRWGVVLQQHPEHPVGYVGSAGVLRAAGRLAAADALLQQAVTRLPEHLGLALEYARIAQRRGDLAAMRERLQHVRARFADDPAAHLGIANTLLDGKQVAEAATAAEAGLAVFPQHCQLRITLANAALRRGDHDETERLWADLHHDFPADAAVIRGYATALRQNGRLDRAERIVAAACEAAPDDLELAVQRGRNANARRDWPAALALWEGLNRRAPSNPGVREGIGEALWQARIDQETGVAAGNGVPPDLLARLSAQAGDAADQGEARALLMGFESLGNSCEFGILQRRFGAEPLGLLRWASITPDGLVAALQQRFEGVGEPGQTELVLVNGEYRIRDTRFGFSGHTFTSDAQVEREALFRQQCLRLRFLRRLMLETLAADDKVLVYKCELDATDAQLAAIHRAARAYHRNKVLLGVRLERPDRPSGTLLPAEDGLFLGYLDRFSNSDISVDAWLALCSGVRRQGAAG